MMKETGIAEVATSLLKAHGGAAEAEAAKKVREFEDTKDADQAGDWRRIRSAIASMRGPHAS